VGTVVAIPLFILLSYLSPLSYLIMVAALTLGACYLAGEGEKIWGRQDPSVIVIDEIVGFLWTVAFLPATWVTIGVGFILFRFSIFSNPFPFVPWSGNYEEDGQ